MLSAVANKVVVITGASQGIGAATATYLAEKGAKVVLASRSEAKITALADEIGSNGFVAMAVPCDVCDASQVEALMKAAYTAYGSVDVVINNAGRIDPVATIDESDPTEWSGVVDTNLKGVYYGMRFACDAMDQNGGTIINISSGAATSTLEGWSHYCATKAAVLSLTKSGHKELYEKKGIRVVGLSPGTVATDMQRVIKDSGINPVSKLDWSKHIPAEYVARAIEFLVGQGGDKYLGTDFSLKTNEGREACGLPVLA